MLLHIISTHSLFKKSVKCHSLYHFSSNVFFRYSIYKFLISHQKGNHTYSQGIPVKRSNIQNSKNIFFIIHYI